MHKQIDGVAMSYKVPSRPSSCKQIFVGFFKNKLFKKQETQKNQ